jgi:hypothetical protein
MRASFSSSAIERHETGVCVYESAEHFQAPEIISGAAIEGHGTVTHKCRPLSNRKGLTREYRQIRNSTCVANPLSKMEALAVSAI